YFSSGGWFIDDGHATLVPDEYGNLSFWDTVGTVDPNPCATGPMSDPGPRVQDLADALAAQRHRRVTEPVPVTLARHHGLYLESRAAGALTRCHGDKHTLFRTVNGSLKQSDDIPGTIDRWWIMDVDGRRIVAAVQVMPGKTAHPAELVGIAESARFDLAE